MMLPEFDPAFEPVLSHAHLVFIDHPTDPNYQWTGFGKLEHDTGDGLQTWIGCSELGRITRPPDDGDVSVESMVLSLSGVTEEFAFMLAAEEVRGNICTVWRVILDDNRKVVKQEEIIDSLQDYVDFSLDEDGTATVNLHVLDKFHYLAQQSTRTLSPEYLKVLMDEYEIAGTVSGADDVHELPGSALAWFPPV